MVGPNGFTNTFNEFDFRPGGKWSFIMHGPDKGNYSNECVFTKIEPPVFISWYRLSKPLFSIEVSLNELKNEKTLLTFKMIFETSEECDKVKSFAPGKNEENFDRLETELKKVLSGHL
jgi:uncharacterized protein YndB with AHSA1/START domain